MMRFHSETMTNEAYSLLSENGLKSAALFYLGINDTPMQRAGRVVRQYFAEELPASELFYGLPDNQPFLGSGFRGDKGGELGLYVDIVGDVHFDAARFQKVADRYQDDPRLSLVMKDIMWDADVRHYDQGKVMPGRYHHGGGHSVCDIKKILRIGLRGIAKEIESQREAGEDPVFLSFCDGLLDTIKGVELYIKRSAEDYARMAEESGDASAMKVAEAYRRGLFMEPPETFYDVFLTVLFLVRYFFSEAGRIDQYLLPYYERDLAAGILTKEEAAALFDSFFHRIDDVTRGGAHHIVIGGCDESYKPSYNELTKLILFASRKYAQPNVSLRVSDDMPEDIWEIVLGSLGAGKSNPALVYEKAYIDELIHAYGVEPEDAIEFGLGGCSETLINGMSNVDGTWTAYNLLDVFHETMSARLLATDSYEDFYRLYFLDVEKTAREMIDQINLRQHMDIYKTDPLRTLVHKGCLERGESFWRGGAKYNFDNTNIYGATNAVNGLVVIKALYGGELGVSRREFLDALDANFLGHDDLLRKVRALPKFGNNDAFVNDVARELMTFTFGLLRATPCFRGDGAFMPSVIDYVEFERIGKKIPATADGRLAAMPMVDSIGPVPGTDTNGPTAMLNSVAVIPMGKAAGTCVLNVRFDPACFSTKSNRNKIKSLIETWFKIGGHQLQVNVVDTELLKEAMKNPDEHRDIIVRVGGYTDYFVCLSEGIQQSIIERTSNGV